MGKHNQVVVGNWYDTEKYYKVQPGNKDSLVRYFSSGSKVSFAVHFIPKGIEPAPQHKHPHEQFLIVPIGDGEAIIDGEHYPTEPGFFAILPSNLPHGYDSTKATHTCWNLDIFSPARLEYEKENYMDILAQGKNVFDVMITDDDE